MPNGADRENVGALRYRAELAWLGPIQGGIRRGRDLRVRIGGASDPALGEALAAVLLPVVRDQDDKHFELPSNNGKPREIVDIGWAFALDNDRDGHFRFDVPTVLWEGGVGGVLMVLLYDQSGIFPQENGGPSGDRRFPGTWVDQLEALDVKLAAPEARRGAPIRDLPEPMQIEIANRVSTLLRDPLERLEPGLIELDVPVADPEKSADSLTFAVASCQYPSGFLDRDVAEDAYRRLACCLEDARLKPRCLLLVGDQIYADATAGLFDPSTLYDRFELPYERLLRMPALRRIQRCIPVYMMLDDHEIEDNWEPTADNRRPHDNLTNGRRFYLKYQRMAGPAAKPRLPDSPHPLWYEFELDGIPFFMADTRTERDHRSAQSLDDARIMKNSQFEALLRWLHKPGRDVPKFISSPACLLPRKLRAKQHDHRAGALRSDAWDGYPHSLHRLLAYIVENEISNVVFLSGDEHISFATRATVAARDSGKVVSIYSIHSSALYAPFPFANAVADDLAWEDRFEFSLPPEGAGRPGGAYCCHVDTEFAPPGDGFTLVQVLRENGEWAVRCGFSRNRYAHAAFVRGCFGRGRMDGGRFVENIDLGTAANWLSVF
jgi:cholesterol oxidase